MKVSVIIPFVNETIYMDDCLDSLDEQTCKEFEAVVVCDNSSEEAVEKLRIRKDPFPLVIQELTNQSGVAAARNVGIRTAIGEYILFLDCDDYLEKTAIEEMLHCAANGADLIRAGMRETWYGRRVYYDHGEKLDAQNNTPDIEGKEEMDLTVLGLMLRRDFLVRQGYFFDESYHYYADLTFIASLLASKAVWAGTTDILYLKRKHNDPVQMPSLSQIPDHKNKISEVLRAYSQMKDLLTGSQEVMLDGKMLRYFINTIAEWYATVGESDVSEIHQEVVRCLNQIGGEAVACEPAASGRLMRYAIRHTPRQIARRLQRREMVRTWRTVIRSRAACKKYLYRTVFLRMKLKDNLVVFESFLGQSYSDSPKYIFESLSKKSPGRYRCVWILNKKETLPYPAKCITRYSFPYFYYIARAKYFVFNGRQSKDFIKREGSIFLETWHGTPLKKLVFDMDEVTASSPLYKRDVYRQAGDWDYLIAPNRFCSEIFRRCFLYNGSLLETGYPRNDLLHLGEEEKREQENKIRTKLAVPDGKKIILYAPTWRDDEFYAPGKHKFRLELDLEAMRTELGGDYVLLIRTHYFVADQLDLSVYGDFVRNVSGYDDIAELYLVSDILITDYSSVFFDYANLKRPILFFTYDLEKYRDVLRGFYIDLEKELPGPLLFTTEEVIDATRNLSQIKERYHEKYEMFYETYCGWEDGNASQRVVDAVFK